MNTMVWLTVASVVAVSALFVALAVFLVLILRELNPTGGHGRASWRRSDWVCAPLRWKPVTFRRRSRG